MEYLKIAELSDEDVARIEALEAEYGVHIMAYQPGLELARLTDAQIGQMKGVEDGMGVILIAYQPLGGED